MASDSINYGAVLQDLRTKRAAIDAAITAMEQIVSLGATDLESTGSISVAGNSEPSELRKDSFFGLTIPDAIRKALRIAKQPLTLSALTANLRQGGMLSNAGDLMRTVSATLARMKKNEGEVVQVQGGWALREWYPGMRREKVEAVAKPKAKKKKRARQSPAAASDPQTPKRKFGESKVTPEQVQQIRERANAGISQNDIAKEFGLSRSGVQHILRRTAGDGPQLRVVPKPDDAHPQDADKKTA
jgi:hypothetical protein